MLLVMMLTMKQNRRPQESSSGSQATGRSASSSPTASSSVMAAGNSPALAQLGKSSNSSNETVIALDQQQQQQQLATPSSELDETLPQISANSIISGSSSTVQLAEESRCPSEGDAAAASRMMSQHSNQDQGRNAADAMPNMKELEQTSAGRQDTISGSSNASPDKEQPEQQRQQPKQSIGRLGAFLSLTRAHLSPFRRQSNQRNSIKQHQVQRKQSLDSSSSSSSASLAKNCSNNHHNLRQTDSIAAAASAREHLEEAESAAAAAAAQASSRHHRHQKFVNLFNLAQRCFFFKQSSEFSLNQANASLKQRSSEDVPCESSSSSSSSAKLRSRSAPVTPIKWNPLTGADNSKSEPLADAISPKWSQIPNGLGSASACSGAKQSGSFTKPSVRFVESAGTTEPGATNKPAIGRQAKTSGGGGGSSKWRAVHTQTSPADQHQQPAEELRQLEPAGSSNGVADLFKLQDVVEEGESPMNSTSFRQHGYSLIDYISNYLDTIKERRVTPLNIEPGYLKELIQPAAPAQGESFANIMHDFENHIMCGITHWQHPHFHAYFPAGNAYPSILADMLSDALGCVGFSWAASPAYTELEIIMLDWMGKMIGLPDEFLCLSSDASGGSGNADSATTGRQRESKGGGVIQGSASECVLVNLLAARHWAMEKLRKKYPHTQDGILLTKLIGYCSKEAHSCVEKAAMIGFIRMRALETDEQHSLRGETLAKAIAMDKANGLEPFLVCATLGTTSCVSFDNLAELGPVCRDEDIWLHVDAAYAGSALICPEFQYLMKGIELVTSFNMNPNKWMLINFDCSLMWVKDRFKLTRAFVVDPLYLQHSFSDQAIDYRHWGIPLSRRFRALKLWFVIRNYGVAGLQAYIRNHVRLAKLFEQLIRQDSRFTIQNQVVLGLVCFRLIGSNALNQRLLSMINASGKLHMVPASLEGRYVIRFCVCDQNAKEEDIRYAYECIAQIATELFESIRAGKERIRAISQQNTIDVSNVSLHTQQSASADRLNRMATANQSTSSGASIGVASSADSSGAVPAAVDHHHNVDELQRQPARIASPHREAARQYLMASRRNSHAINGESEQHPPGGAKSPLQKQTSLVATGACSEPASATVAAAAAADAGTDQDDLEQEIVLDSLASIDGFDYDLDDEDDDDVVNEDDLEDECAAAQAGALNDGATSSAAPGDRSSSAAAIHRRRLRSSQTTAASCAPSGERDEAEDEVFHLLAKERRNRMSLRYKREFFVRVVSDPRVYRASISGDINADSCNSLANQQHTAPATTTSVPPYLNGSAALNCKPKVDGNDTTAATRTSAPARPTN